MGELREAQRTEGVLVQTHIGGQALLEGVMMRGRYNWAVAVRQPDGSIYTEQHDLASGKDRASWMRIPVIRGCVAFVESLALGYKALGIAADHAFDLSEEGGPAAADESGDAGSEGVGQGMMVLSFLLGLVFAIVVFIVAPAALTNLIMGDYTAHTLAWNLVDGCIRVALFILYVWGISFMEDIRRMFGYHGAEHKTIHCYEHGRELTPENAQGYPRLHVRCGTAFLVMTLIVAIIVFSVVPVGPLIDQLGVTNPVARLVLVMVSRLVLLPLVAGVSYEVTVKWAGSRPDDPLVKVVLWPGMQMQRLTTRQPDEDMLECAIVAMQLVIEREVQEAQVRGIHAEGLLPSDDGKEPVVASPAAKHPCGHACRSVRRAFGPGTVHVRRDFLEVP